MRFDQRRLAALLALGTALVAGPALAQTAQELEATNPNPNDWLSYHGTYKGYDYSGLDQITADNVKDLQVAWMHFPGKTIRGIESMPLAKDGVLYYSGSFSRVFALDGATGKVLWTYFPELDDQLVARQTHSPYNRGMAMGDGKLYVGTVDGRLIAIDTKTGKPAWDTKLIDSEKLTVGFTGAPIFARGTVVIGAQGGEWPYRGPLFARRRGDRQEEVGILHIGRHARGDEDLGQRHLANWWWRRLDARNLRSTDQRGVVGRRQSRSSL